MVLKASILDSLGGPLTKEGSFANYEHTSKFAFGVVVFKASILDSLGGPSAKEHSSANYEHTSKLTLASQRSFL